MECHYQFVQWGDLSKYKVLDWCFCFYQVNLPRTEHIRWNTINYELKSIFKENKFNKLNVKLYLKL
jgi:hypothetical protein